MPKRGSASSACPRGCDTRSRLLSSSASTMSMVAGRRVPASEIEHRLGGGEGEASFEHRALGEAACSIGLSSSHDQSIAPRSVAWRAAVPRVPASRRETIAQPLDDLRRAQQPYPRGGQLDRQRHAVEQPHDSRHRGVLRRVGSEAAELQACPRHEQRDRPVRVALERQRLERQHALAVESQPFAAGDDEARAAGAVEPARKRLRHRRQHLLDVVEDDEAGSSRRDRMAELRHGRRPCRAGCRARPPRRQARRRRCAPR